MLRRELYLYLLCERPLGGSLRRNQVTNGFTPFSFLNKKRMKAKHLLKICILFAIFSVFATQSVRADLYYELDHTEYVTIECGEIKTLDPTTISGDVGSTFRWYRNHLSNERGVSDCTGYYAGQLEIINKYKVYTPHGNSSWVDSYKCDVIGLKPGTYDVMVVWHTESRYYDYFGSTTGYNFVRCTYRVTVKSTNNPTLTLTANNTCRRVFKGTNIQLTPNISGADIYYDGPGKTSDFYDSTYPTAGITLTDTGNNQIRALAVKKGYPPSELFDHTYYVIEPGDFHVVLAQGTDVHFKVISESDKTCGVYYVPETVTGHLRIPSSINGYKVIWILRGAFSDCKNLTSVELPEHIDSIGSIAFADCTSLVSINIPNSVTAINNMAFRDCKSLKTIEIPKSVIRMYTGTFENSGLTKIEIPSSIDKIPSIFCKGCEYLKEVIIPKSITEINNRAFQDCPALESVTSFIEDPFPIDESIFRNGDELWTSATLYVPKGCKEKYESTQGWLLFQKIEEMEDSAPTGKGDVNGDGSVNGTDLVMLANIVLGKQAETKAADVNGDNSVNGTDMVALANIILGRKNAKAVNQQATLSIEESFDIKAGETKEMTINLTNPNDELTLVQFDLQLPTGLSIAETNGDLDFDMGSRTTWRKHTLDANKVGSNAYRFLLYSSSNTLISGTEGGIIKVTLTADESFTGGTIALDNILLVSPDQEEIKPERYTYTIGTDPTPGPTPEPTPDSTPLTIEDFAITAGTEATMTIDLTNPNDELTLVQFDLQLPTGLSIAETNGELDIDMGNRTNWRKHTLDANKLGDSLYRFLLYSSSNTLISGTEGGIIQMTLAADESFNGGTIVLDNILLVSPDQKEIKPERYTYTFGTKPTDIDIHGLTFYIDIGEEEALPAEITPADATTTLTWWSDNPNVAVVSSSGVVTGISNGTTWIGVETDNGLSDLCMVIVKRNPTYISIPAEITINVCSALHLSTEIMPKDAETTLEWWSDDNNIAKVGQDGCVLGNKPGTTMINVETDNGLIAQCQVTVQDTLDFVSLGYGTFMDCFWKDYEKEVEIQQGRSQPNIFRIVRPYDGITDEDYWSSEYLQIEVYEDSLVYFWPINTGLIMDYQYEIWLWHPGNITSMLEDISTWQHNRVLSYYKNNQPKIIQLAPSYWITNGWWDCTQEDDIIKITLPAPDTDGIAGVTQDANSSDSFYNLSGQRVERPRKGLYIKGGKKVLVK